MTLDQLRKMSVSEIVNASREEMAADMILDICEELTANEMEKNKMKPVFIVFKNTDDIDNRKKVVGVFPNREEAVNCAIDLEGVSGDWYTIEAWEGTTGAEV